MHLAASSLVALAAILPACTIHPKGEDLARQQALTAGQPYRRPFEQRTPPTLSATPTAEEVARYAELTSADLEANYWEWRAALEQVPQEGTQKSGVELSFETMITNGTTALEDTVLSVGNDAMNSLVLPSKLGTQASAALHDARAAGYRFDKARFELRNKVLSAWYDLALTAELLRLEEENARLLELMSRITESRLATSTATQTDLLKASNEVAMSKNEAAILRSKLESQRAALNGLVNRPADAPLELPAALPQAGELQMDDVAILNRVALNNPELHALSQEIAGKEDALQRARLEYLPDFNVNVSSDLAGVSQSLMGSIVVPFLRHEALDAAIRQEGDRLRRLQAMRRQSGHDLASRAVADLVLLRDAQRQVELYDQTLLPRARQIIAASQTAYATSGSLLDLLDSQRSLISLQRMRAELQIEPLKQLADLEEIAGQSLVSTSTRPDHTR